MMCQLFRVVNGFGLIFYIPRLSYLKKGNAKL